jgi:hypothetical protein
MLVKRIMYCLALVCFSMVSLKTVAQSQISPGTGRFKTSSSKARRAVTLPPESADQPIAGIAGLTYNSPPNVTLNSVVNDVSNPVPITIHNATPVDYVVTQTTAKKDPTFTIANCTPNIVSTAVGDCVLNITYLPTAATAPSYDVLTITLTPANVTGTPPPTQTITLPMAGYPASTCLDTFGYRVVSSHYFAPLDHKGVDEATINCYYNVSKSIAFATQVSYQYNPNGNTSNLSSNLFSFQFTGGVQLSIFGNATTSSCADSTVSSGGGSSPTSSNSCQVSAPSGSSQGTATSSLTQNVQSIEQGGDFGIRATWPFLNFRAKRMQVSSIANPQFGFALNGLTAQTTSTAATDLNINIANESYFQLDAIPDKNGGDSPASLFADVRVGYEHISPTFAASTKLTSNQFVLAQIQAGIVINGALKISAQRYIGPSQVFLDSSGNGASANNFNTWQLGIQITPSSLAGK